MLEKKICVLGLGYIGLPTAAMFATHGCKVIGVDIDDKVVDELNKGRVIIQEPFLDIMVQAAVRSGNLIAYSKPQQADVFIIAVPTPITEDKKADLSYVKSATESIVEYLKKDDIVILESTCPAGTVQDIIIPILNKSGLKVGEELYVGHSPERVLPGHIINELVKNDRIVGGLNKESTNKIKDLYKIFVNGKIYSTDDTTAEMCKLIENTFRDVNIALANELLKICEKSGISAWEVIYLSNKHPRVNIHNPGPGVGGHCLAIDPWFIVEKNHDTSKLIELARIINDSMPSYVFDRINSILKDIEGKKKVTILGITYKPNIDDLRESPIIELIELMEESKEYEISVYDPYIKAYKYSDSDIIAASENSDLVLLAVHHNEFKELPLNIMARQMRTRNFFDTRNSCSSEDVEKAGFKYHLLGKI